MNFIFGGFFILTGLYLLFMAIRVAITPKYTYDEIKKSMKGFKKLH